MIMSEDWKVLNTLKSQGVTLVYYQGIILANILAFNFPPLSWI